MSSVWAEGVRHSLDESLQLLGEFVRDCPDSRWRAPMWRVRTSEIAGDVFDSDSRLITDPVQREARIQRWSEPWSVAWHTLEVFDYDLSGELEPWIPPARFADHPHWRDFTSLPEPWSKEQIAGYVDHCHRRVSDTFETLTEDKAATPLPSTHRYAGQPYAQLVTGLIAHTTAHATQIRQFSAS